PLVAGPDYEYRVGVRVSYDYSAEAAFTESSRWSSGNQLLEVWRESAWQELSLQEREAWKNRKCGTITKVGQKFERQRTAALTTPVVPVMYTYCGIQLFDNFGKDGKKGKVPITIGVTVNSENLDTDKGFTVKKVTSNCFSQKMENLQGGFVGSEWVKGDQGWVPEKGSLTLQKNRNNVKIKGERKSIACRTRMNLRINVLKWYGRYTIPVIGR
ncbi:MAG: hypothetical protein SVQ76_01540, partial [Candidatus Nanohaloarchaea archaeon]|nr:hypothetical protein [Candidatus Nanohaloarchaea archaeon]